MFIRSLLSHIPYASWGFRALTPFATVGVIFIVCGLLGIEGTAVLVLMFAALLAQLLTTEITRRGGSILSSGLGITPSMPRMLLIGLAGSVISIVVVAGIAYALGAKLVMDGNGTTILAVAVLIMASFLEELFFRGTMFEAVRERFGSFTAVGVTSVLFGLAHVFNNGASPIAIVNVVLAGFLFGVLTIYSGSLWPAMVFHATWNVLVRAFFGTVSGNAVNGWISTLDMSGVSLESQWFISGSFGIEQGVCTTLVLCAAIVASVAFVRPDGTVRAARFRRDHYNEHHA